MISRPRYDPHKDGNVFKWILQASESYREMRKIENSAAKEATAVIRRLDKAKVEDQKW